MAITIASTANNNENIMIVIITPTTWTMVTKGVLSSMERRMVAMKETILEDCLFALTQYSNHSTKTNLVVCVMFHSRS